MFFIAFPHEEVSNALKALRLFHFSLSFAIPAAFLTLEKIFLYSFTFSDANKRNLQYSENNEVSYFA